ncbi:potassium channel protein [Actinomadura sp. NBRC 104412]|uniref:potassium channel family protein n=1 Tax=Actinomadura sp. NBRC 104412 TaxID=3032203 RepID=UPI0024A135A5|nr:potassium channel family protein [Actinomadura sp. NBRC 104412]GLZ05867.1 potassium channel protein [Actinomadura sp. NBRC 104412]
MPIVLKRLVHRVAARSWRLPALVMFGAAIVGWLLIVAFEKPDAEIRDPLHYVWYFFISATTVGYGDLYPETTGGRVGGVLVIMAGLTAGLMLFAELTLWMAKGRTMKANGRATLHHRGHIVIIGYEREGLRAIIGQLRADPHFARTPVVAVFWPDQLSGENPDPDVYDVVLFDDTAFDRAAMAEARTVLVIGHNDDETVRVMLSVNAFLRRNGAHPAQHLLAGVHDGGSRMEINEALALVDPDIEPVDIDDPAVVAVAIRNPGVAQIYHNLASTLDSDSTLFRVDIPENAGEWLRLDLAIFLLHRGSTLLAVGESHRPNARFRLAATPGETVRGGQSLAIVARDRPQIPWSELPSTGSTPTDKDQQAAVRG